MVPLPLYVGDVLHHVVLVELLTQHFGGFAVVVAGAEDVGGAGTLAHQELNAR